jgi:hypothetical protein
MEHILTRAAYTNATKIPQGLMPWKRRFCSYREDFLEQIFSCIGIYDGVCDATATCIEKFVDPNPGLSLWSIKSFHYNYLTFCMAL